MVSCDQILDNAYKSEADSALLWHKNDRYNNYLDGLIETW